MKSKVVFMVFIFVSVISSLFFQNCSDHNFSKQDRNDLNNGADSFVTKRDVASLSLTTTNKSGYITIKGNGSGKVTWAMAGVFGGYGKANTCYTYKKECSMNLAGGLSAFLTVVPDFGSKISTDPNDLIICSAGGGAICTANDSPLVTFVIDPDVKSINNITLSNQGDGAGTIQSSEQKTINARVDNCNMIDATRQCIDFDMKTGYWMQQALALMDIQQKIPTL
jgi:hypothetical protein